MSSFYKPKGADEKFKPYETRRDIRRTGTKLHEFLLSTEGGGYILGGVVVGSFVAYSVPLSSVFLSLTSYFLHRIYMRPDQRIINFPWRVPLHAKLFDGSKNKLILDELHDGNVKKYKPEEFQGKGITYYGVDRETGLQVYSDNSDDRTHIVVLGTTGSGKTELLLALVTNMLIQDSGFIFLDAKGDPSLQKDISRLARRFLRDDDRLTINFITSGRNLAKAQRDKVTNTFNLMSNTSDQMLIELLNNLLDSSGGDEMWKGRAMTFIASLTVVLVYLRDNGFIQLSPTTYIKYLELSALEELIFEHDGKYGEQFSIISESLKNYITTLPAYKNLPRFRKRQDADTMKQHGFIVMQLTRCFNELTYNYKYIFGVAQGDIDIFDCVLNRRILTIPLPALERTVDSLKLLGKLCIGSVKQMMASSLGNRIDGLVREILDARATNAVNTFKLIFDEVGYVMVKGISVMPAQGRSLNFAICFAAQDFSDIRRGDEHEAEAIFGNAGAKFIGRLVIGKNGETMNKINGLVSDQFQARQTSSKMVEKSFGWNHVASPDTNIQREEVLPFDDLAGQSDGEFTLIVGARRDGGVSSGIRVVRIQAFFVAGEKIRYLRMNDLCPNLSIPVDRLQNPNERIKKIKDYISISDSSIKIGQNKFVEDNRFFEAYQHMTQSDFYKKNKISCIQAFLNNAIDTVIDDEVVFVKTPSIATAGIIEDGVNNHHVNEDREQTLTSEQISISKIVKQDQNFKTDVEEIITRESSFVGEAIVTVDVHENLDTSVVNIFNFMDYAAECYERLKKYNINCTPVKQGYQLLPFMPSQVNELSREENKELIDSLRKIQDKVSFKPTKDTAKSASLIHEMVSFDLSVITNSKIKKTGVVDGEQNTVLSTREKASKLLDVIEIAKKGIRFE